jgi:hypothetical protein
VRGGDRRDGLESSIDPVARKPWALTPAVPSLNRAIGSFRERDKFTRGSLHYIDTTELRREP